MSTPVALALRRPEAGKSILCLVDKYFSFLSDRSAGGGLRTLQNLFPDNAHEFRDRQSPKENERRGQPRAR